MRVSKRGTRLKSGYLFACSLVQRENGCTGMLLIITSAGDELLRNVDIDGNDIE